MQRVPQRGERPHPIEERYKGFPPGSGQLRIPTSSRGAALVGLAMYAPCRPSATWVLRVARLAVRVLGPHGLPGRRRPWRAPVEPEVWAALVLRWSRELGSFDSMAVYQRTQSQRTGVALMLVESGRPIGFVRLQPGSGRALAIERRAQQALCMARPRSFRAPEPLAAGELAGWHYSAASPVLSRAHHVPRNPPLDRIAGEIETSLLDLPRPLGMPSHWRPMHGDLTPWNLRQLDDGTLALIDWEDAGWGPPGADTVLYRAVSAALRGKRADRSHAGEAIEFWEERLRNRPAEAARDRRLTRSLLDALEQMRPQSRESAAS